MKFVVLPFYIHTHTYSKFKRSVWCFKTSSAFMSNKLNTETKLICVLRCVPKHRVCLSNSSDCPQYECIGRPAACDRNKLEPACDTDGLVHPSLCHLHQAGKMLAYMGHCQVTHSSSRDLCSYCCLFTLFFYFHGCLTNSESEVMQPWVLLRDPGCRPSSRFYDTLSFSTIGSVHCGKSFGHLFGIWVYFAQRKPQR